VFDILVDVELAKQGDKEAFEKLIVENKVAMYKVAISILRNDEDAGDAISETIFKAYKSIKNLKDVNFFKTWLIRILINECNYMLKQKRRIVSIENYQVADTTNEHNVSDDSIDIQIALDKLDKELKLIVVLYYYNKMKIEEIANILNIAEGTIKSRLYTARKKLYEILNCEKGGSVV